MDWTGEVLALVALAAVFVIFAAHRTELPAVVPVHFRASGMPDRWGGKGSLLLLPLTAVGIYVLLTVAARYPDLMNLPMKVDREAPEVRGILQSMAIALKIAALTVFAYLERAQVNTALGRSEGLGKAFLPISLISVFAILGLFLRELRKHRE